MEKVVMQELVSKLSLAARDRRRISGLTHNFYRYPARFSPTFAATAIECFSEAGDLILDPYMGGGTTIVEAIARGRRAVGNDLNSLATFVTKVKTTPLDSKEARAVSKWASRVVPNLNYRISRDDLESLLDSDKTYNLTLARGRFIKKVLAGAIKSVVQLPTKDAQDFARCAILGVAQWALDGRRTHTPLSEFRKRLSNTVTQMLVSIDELHSAIGNARRGRSCVLSNGDAANIGRLPIFGEKGERAKLVVTSPPYPGIHVLYHRWQVDGRRETPAPYWIAGCADGQGASFYNFGDRRERDANTYFATSLETLLAIRRAMATNGVIVQMVAFSDQRNHLPRYLENMEQAGFRELCAESNRIWRNVPNRRWHASLQGQTSSAREVVLVHEAV
jgi:DNA modification methylase